MASAGGTREASDIGYMHVPPCSKACRLSSRPVSDVPTQRTHTVVDLRHSSAGTNKEVRDMPTARTWASSEKGN